MNESKSLNEKSSFTADGVAYRRTFTEIPHSLDIFDILQEIEGPLDPKEKARADDMPNLAPYFESRYLMTDWALEEIGLTNIVELASGLSPRGFEWTMDDPTIRYIEIDLPDKMRLKKRIIAELCERIGTRLPTNISFQEGNVIDPKCFDTAEMFFSEGSSEGVAVICEGLLRYMNWQDKETLTKNIVNFLANNGGGVWITPDIELLSEANASPEMQARYEKMTERMGFDVRPNLFRNLEHALNFFRGFGFSVRMRAHDGIADMLISPKRLGLNPETVRKELAKRVTFVMSL